MASRRLAGIPPRLATFIALAVVLAFVFARLGVWQVDRLAQRRARNATLERRLAEPVRPFRDLPDTMSFRRAAVTGAVDYEHEIVLTGRSRNGSPGVYILTPVRPLPGLGDTAILVIRGWVYAPDAASVDLGRWHETRERFTGYVASLSPTPAQPAVGRKVRTLSLQPIRAAIPYPIASRYVVSLDSAADTTPARLTMPELGNGPHLSYAIQWFSFAIIALVGAVVVAMRARLSPDDVGRGRAPSVDYR